jgi:hypothetical protein
LADVELITRTHAVRVAALDVSVAGLGVQFVRELLRDDLVSARFVLAGVRFDVLCRVSRVGTNDLGLEFIQMPPALARVVLTFVLRGGHHGVQRAV